MNCYLVTILGILPINVKKDECEKYEKVRQELIRRQSEQKLVYDRNSHNLKPLSLAENVFVRKQVDKPLEPGIVTKICNRPRAYEVEMSNGRKLERNRVHLYKKTTEFDYNENVQSKAFTNVSQSYPIQASSNHVHQSNSSNSNHNVQTTQPCYKIW